nr:sugar ABC transporter permease [Blautia argi]
MNFKLRKFLNKESSAGVVFCMPFIIGFLVFLIIPMGMSLYYSFCDYDILSPPVFTGLDNYIEIFTADETFWHSVKATFLFVFVSVPLRLIFALIVALILVKSTKATGFYRAAYYLPSILGGSVAVAVLWRRIFATDGVLNSILGMFGLDTQFAWLGNTKTAIWTLVLLAIWQFGSSMLIFLSALKQIPRDLYEAADVDGANKFVKFFKITLPLLTPTIFFNLVMQMINGFLAFTQSLIITDGKPMDSTLFYAVYMYRQAFSFNHAGICICNGVDYAVIYRIVNLAFI